MTSPRLSYRLLPQPLPWLAGLLLVYLIAPLVAVLWPVAHADWSQLGNDQIWRATATSFASASVATVLIALGGVPLGYYLAQRSGRAGRLLGFIVQLPLALPPLTSGILLLFLLGPYSPLGGLLGRAGIELTDSFAGIVLAEAFVAAPFLIIAARSAFAAIDPELIAVAATLGRGPWACFVTVSLPLAWPAIVAGLLLSWLRAFGEFGATVMMAYHPYSLPVYTFVSFGSDGLQAMLPLLLPTLACALLIVVAAQFLLRPRRARALVDPHTPLPVPLPRRAVTTQAPPLQFTFVRHLPGFSLDIHCRTQARRIAVLGRSGSGKSMTLRLLAGLEPAAQAHCQLGQQRLDTLPTAARAIAYVPQRYGLFPHLRVNEQYRFGVGADVQQARAWSEQLGLDALGGRYPAELSMGQQQRVALVRALARPSRLILLDEPFSALDTPLRAQLRLSLRQLQRQVDATWLLVTHDPQDAALLADEIIVMEAGRILQQGPTRTLFEHPGSEQVARLLGQSHVFAAQRQANGCLAIGAQPTAVPAPSDGGDAWLLRLHPRAIVLDPQGAYEALVEDHLDTGETELLQLRWGALLLDAAYAGSPPTIGSACRFDLAIEARDIWSAST
ncbi:MAG: ATP-binding cassette domain-containing protein [Dyella sp.]